MVTQVPVYDVEDTLDEVEDLLTHNSCEYCSIDYIYITTSEKILKGVISIKDLLKS